MITEEEYISALRIVEAYHKQIGLSDNLVTAPKTIDDLKEGDYVLCTAIKPSTTGLEVGRSYQIITLHRSESYKYRHMWIRIGAGKQKQLNLNPSYWAVPS